jgi:phospholysine phosphohistidine inorganic pyrophosphate phosphatase
VVSESEILTPAVAAAEWLRGQQAQEIALLVRPAIRREFADLPCFPEQAEAGASYVVVGGLGSTGMMARSTAPFGSSLTIRKPNGWPCARPVTGGHRTGSLDVGPFIAALEYATGRKR